MTVADQSRLAIVDCASLTDGELLEQFTNRHDDLAFAALLHRHGPMVWGVCRRGLRNDADAEDAFQATFMVLVRKAATIRPRNLVGNWLYGVAHTTALKARAMSIKRAAREHEAAKRTQSPIAPPTWNDLLPVLDQELKALPTKYRAAIVLCDIEGKSLKEVGRQLGCPPATIGTRVARGRVMLARRLSRHGVMPSVGALSSLLSQNAATATVPAKLTTTTTRAAVALSNTGTTEAAVSTTVMALTTAVLKSMLLTKLKIVAAALLLASVIAIGGVTLAHNSSLAGPTKITKGFKSDKHRLQNTWIVTSVIRAGQELPAELLANYGELTLDCERFTARLSNQSAGTFKFDATQDPDEIDIYLPMPGLPADCPPLNGPGIYKLAGRTLTICLAGSSNQPSARPREFASNDGKQWTSIFVLQRKPVEKDKRRP